MRLLNLWNKNKSSEKCKLSVINYLKCHVYIAINALTLKQIVIFKLGELTLIHVHL